MSYFADLKLSWVVFFCAILLSYLPSSCLMPFLETCYVLLVCPIRSMLILCQCIEFGYFTVFYFCVHLVGEYCVLLFMSNVTLGVQSFYSTECPVIVFNH